MIWLQSGPLRCLILMDCHYWSNSEIPGLMAPRAKRAARECGGRAFPLLFPSTFTFASIFTQPNIWTPPWAKCLKQTSKGRADTAARRSDFTANRPPSIWPGRYFDLLEMRMRRREWQHLGCKPEERPRKMQMQSREGE